MARGTAKDLLTRARCYKYYSTIAKSWDTTLATALLKILKAMAKEVLVPLLKAGAILSCCPTQTQHNFWECRCTVQIGGIRAFENINIYNVFRICRLFRAHHDILVRGYDKA